MQGWNTEQKDETTDHDFFSVPNFVLTSPVLTWHSVVYCGGKYWELLQEELFSQFRFFCKSPVAKSLPVQPAARAKSEFLAIEEEI